jgi:hypothetical protein
MWTTCVCCLLGKHVYYTGHFCDLIEVIMSYHIYGDSNICRYLPSVKAKSTDPQYATISYTKVTNLVLLRDALTKPEAGHPIIVISALTNLLVAKYFDNFDAMLVHCKAIFTDLLTWIQEGRDTCSGFATQVFRF